MPQLPPGTSIRDTYEVERLIGQGAFAEVYRVKHRFLGRQAMKVFRHGGMTVDDVRIALSEALILSQLRHPNVVHVFDANILETADGLRGYFTMELVPAGTLDDFWRSHGDKLIPVATVVEIMCQICRGLALAHGAKPPIIHRDIKPNNILVGYETNGLRARVSDFGLAKQVNHLTLVASAAGTLPFKPPEAFGEDSRDSVAADVWALGTTMYLLLTDRLPFEVNTTEGWASQSAWDTPFTPASELNLDADPSLDAIMARCLMLDPEERYRDAQELLKALEKWRKAEPSSSPKSRSLISSTGKSQLGQAAAPNRKVAETLAGEALALAREGRLSDAADLMEEAFNKLPDLRNRYESRVKLWRCGVSM